MGVQVSKELRSRLEYYTLEELLTDDKYIAELQQYLPKLPKRSQNNLVKILSVWEKIPSGDSDLPSKPDPPPKDGNSPPKDRNSRTSKLGSLWSIKSEDITIPKSIAEALKQNHCNLLRHWSKNGVDLESPADHYDYTCSVETRRTLDRILWRFLTTFYYDLISELDATKQRCSTTENGGVAFAVTVICKSRRHDPDTVRNKVKNWVKVGRRYRGFVAALCPGCLILFPEKIGDLVWEQYVPIKGEGFDKAIQLLQGLGIVDKCKEEGWNDLSNKVLQTLRVPFQSLIPFQFQPGQQSRIEWTANSSLAPVAGLLVSENLFHNIKVYFENSCRNMILDDHGTLLTPNGAKLHNGLCNDFDSYCFTATMLIEKGLHVEFRRALFKASALVEQILRAEHPRTLACFLEVFIHLIQTGLPEVTSFLRDFIKRMSAKVIRKGHPWGQICWLLGELDSESLDEAMAKTWKCTTDIFDSELGTFSPLAVSVRLDYIKRVYGITNYLEEERLLRDLFAQFGGIPRLSTPRVMLNLAHNLNRQGRHYEAEEMALEVLSLLQEYEIYARRIVERIESLKIISRSQFNQGKTLAAEQTMREAIRMIVDQWGIQHSWVPEFMNVLEGWLRGWGREEDANTLRGEIEELMGKDEIDEQLDGVQGLLC